MSPLLHDTYTARPRPILHFGVRALFGLLSLAMTWIASPVSLILAGLFMLAAIAGATVVIVEKKI